MQYSYYGYQQNIPKPFNPRVNYGWIGEAWGIYRSGAASWLVLYLVLGLPLFLTTLGFTIDARSQDSDSGSGSGSSSSGNDIGSSLGVSGLLMALCFVAFAIACCSAGIALRRVRGETVRPSDIFAGMDRWIAQYIFSLIYVPVILVSSVFLGIGLLVGAGLLLPAFALIANGEGPWKAFIKSIAAMKSDWLGAAAFCFLFLLISVIGTALTLGLGALVFIPMAYIISALAHRDFIERPQSQEIALDQLTAQGVWPPAPTSAVPLFPQERNDQGH